MSEQLFNQALSKLNQTLESYIEENEDDQDYVAPYIQLQNELKQVNSAMINFNTHSTKDQICYAILRKCQSLDFSSKKNIGIQIARIAKFDVL